MNILGEYSKRDLATLYVASFGENEIVEFVESVQPPVPQSEKWVLIISTSFGCPIHCKMCDAGGHFKGYLSSDQMIAQVDHMVRARYPSRHVPVPKFKIQFARMGEPALNPEVPTTIEALKSICDAPGLMPCVSTIAPKRSGQFFDQLLDLKCRLYQNGNFQLQFSIHTTVPDLRDTLMPTKKWDLDEMSRYGERFVKPGDRKIALNFAAVEDLPIDHKILRDTFDPALFLIKLTPLNPTDSVRTNGLRSFVDTAGPQELRELVSSHEESGFEVILSVGEREENLIGTNCGQFASRFTNGTYALSDTYASARYEVAALTE
jgi:23S rRNA (adenine2503-C2)-methyltransferase